MFPTKASADISLFSSASSEIVSPIPYNAPSTAPPTANGTAALARDCLLAWLASLRATTRPAVAVAPVTPRAVRRPILASAAVEDVGSGKSSGNNAPPISVVVDIPGCLFSNSRRRSAETQRVLQRGSDNPKVTPRVAPNNAA